MIPGYLRQNFQLELRKVFAYRAAFWTQFFLRSGVVLLVNYFLWKSIYRDSAQTLGGFAYSEILLYMVFSVSANALLETSEGAISQQIFDGSFTRYLIYPSSFLGFRLSSMAAEQCLGLLQFGLCLALSLVLIPEMREMPLFSNPGDCARGLVACLAAGYLQFLIVTCLDMIAFWVDQVWNLLAMNRFIGSFIGGMYIPLAFFPEALRDVFGILPYASIFQFPILSFLGKLSASAWWQHFGLCLFWCAFFHVLANWILNRGLRRYAGVGQ